MLEGYKRCKPSKDIRSPITLDLLYKIINTLKHVCISNYECHLFSCAFLITFFCWLRVSEVAVPNKHDDSTRVINMRDIELYEDHICVKIRYSKTDQMGKGTTLHVNKSGRTEILFTLLQLYLSGRPKQFDGALLIHFNGQPITSYQFSAMLKKTLTFLDIDVRTFKSHSFRIGAASLAFTDGFTEDEIKKWGRWKSGCYTKYIRVPSL